MRISVVREIEVLRRIHHPSLISCCASFSTPIYTVLALDYAPGGELFDFLGKWHKDMTVPLARRMFGELCSAVGWMHSICLVHRDIKLENILLTARPFPPAASEDPSTILDRLPRPFIKLTDFGLSRFISPESPLLTTRCGSEAYAAPELIMGKKYDGRKTDAWALGVVLYALITGGMPFVENSDGKGRKGYLLKIAKAEFRWPSVPGEPALASSASSSTNTTPVSPTGSTGMVVKTPVSASSTISTTGSSEGEAMSASTVTGARAAAALSDAARLVSPAVKFLVSKLMVRDPEKRIKVDDVWDLEWMRGEGRPERLDGWVTPTSGSEVRGDVLALDSVWKREEV
ncbi:kinase-like protein [Meredithblackwellia eburnea MCA 4105]